MKLKRLEPEGIVIHCSATPPSMDIGRDEINLWHVKRGWSSIGYHWVIRRDGTQELGRSPAVAGAHAYGFNQTTYGICLVGGVDSEGEPEDNYTEAQYATLALLVATLLRDEHQLQFVVGHRELPDVKKACPCFDVYSWYQQHSLIVNLLERNEHE